MTRGPKRLNHHLSVYLIGIFVWSIILFVLAGVVNHLAFSSRGPGLLIPLLNKIQKKASPEQIVLKKTEEAEEHLRFHHFVPDPRPPEALRQTCEICHTDLPHNKTKKIRAMLNMHTNYLACEACHLKENDGTAIVYKWYSPVEKDPKGPFFGTTYDPETGELDMAHAHFSKIAPFHEKNGTFSPMVQTGEKPSARQFLEIREKLTPEQRKSETQRFHIDIGGKGPECQTCHSGNSILDFKALGFSAKRTVDIEALNIKGIITKYDEFYLPDLFKQSMRP